MRKPCKGNLAEITGSKRSDLIFTILKLRMKPNRQTAYIDSIFASVTQA